MEQDTMIELILSGVLEASEDTYESSLREAELENIDDDAVMFMSDEDCMEPDYELD